MSPTQRTMAEVKRLGGRAAIVERWNPHAHVRQDLFGFIDVLAIVPCDATHHHYSGFAALIAIQATTQANAAARVGKILGLEAARLWLRTSNMIEVWGWRKLVVPLSQEAARKRRKTPKEERTNRAMKWELKRTQITLAMFDGQED